MARPQGQKSMAFVSKQSANHVADDHHAVAVRSQSEWLLSHSRAERNAKQHMLLLDFLSLLSRFFRLSSVE